MDVDGTLTDGKINMGNDGELFKSFNCKDGYGIHEILPQYGVKTAIITGRSSRIVENRGKELEIDLVVQGVRDKQGKLLEICREYQITPDEVAYIGDDMNDYAIMELCGHRGCPADAVYPIRELSDYVSDCAGGNGAVRDYIEWLITKKYL